MNCFYIDINIIRGALSEEELGIQVKKHLQYLDEYFDDNTLLLGGSKKSGEGGFVIAKFKDESSVKIFCENDPMYIAGYLDTRIIPFNIYRENLNGWIN